MSPKYHLNSKDLKSIGITIGIVALSAIVAKLLTIVPYLDLGSNTAFYTGLLILLLKGVQKYLQSEEATVENTVAPIIEDKPVVQPIINVIEPKVGE